MRTIPAWNTNWLSVVAILLGIFVGLDAAKAIEPWKQDPYYWSSKGKPVLLLGGSDDDNLFQWPKDKLIPQLDRIQAAGGNFVRNTMSDRKDGGWEVYPFARRDDGKYDLSQWNPEYWHRFETFLKETAQRQIFVQIEVWDRFDYTDNRSSDPKRWENHPYNPLNNINYSAEETSLARRYPKHPGQNDQPFFFSTPQQRNLQPLLKFQEAFVNKLLDHSLKYDHVLYCIDNETAAEPQWGAYWAKLIQKRASAAGKSVPTTEMWDDWDLTAKRHRQTFDHPELYSFVDVSQNNHNSGQTHWENFQYVRKYLAKSPRPINTTKTYGANGNKFGHTDQDAIERFWRHLLGGAAAIRFHRPDSGLGINDKAVHCIQAARLVTGEVPVWDLQPAMQDLTGNEPNECYAAATQGGGTVVLFFPKNDQPRQITWKPSAKQPTHWQVTWIDIDQGQVASEAQLKGIQISPPKSLGNVAAILQKQ
ncbi:hypothetical protein [Blastopirellula marina]|uniref:Collagen-binding domain-containing protein n=1 Tax=Blastopirellula marina TaxID=124 RepID=A0A2S8GDW4_9BACT|nr:hypothetical protein [Blastopirellula marina]PQO42647.1 hypothetical protein C5Y98_02070 [Blastopirellula marina]PTL46413.1 hypothetical protein C5Y97_02070 [Blastopirellula marina]